MKRFCERAGMLLFLFVCLLAQSVRAEECKFNYWQIIPRDTDCEVFQLPDFQFRKLPPADDAPPHIRRFCARYEASAGHEKQETGYCYTGEGDKSGPTFTIAGREFLADMNFIGCLDDDEEEGIVFAPDGWNNPPKNMRRFWPVESLPKKPSCARLK